MDERDEIRSRISIVELVQEGGTQLKQNGKRWKGLCPFHGDKNPSFTVTEETGRYKCFACGEGGDIFTWVMKTQNLEFGDALRILAKRAGVVLASKGGLNRDERGSLDAAMEEALLFFRSELQKASMPKDYCTGRGLDDDILKEWELGFAPDAGEALANHLSRKGFSLKLCEQLFLVQEDSRGGYFDKFRGRLMFPIRDEKGALVAFGGRILGDGHPKYINSGDTPLYKKSRVLYGLNLAKTKVVADRRSVLCEGYLDVIACHRAGVRNAVASLGTALAEDQIKLLKRLSDEIVILYDNDAAGQKAATKAIELLRTESLRVKVALMPQGDDPDVLLRRDGPTAVQDVVKNALTPMEYGLQALQQRIDPAEEEFWTEAVGFLALAASEMELDRYVQRLAPLFPGTTDVIAAGKALRRQVQSARKQRRNGWSDDDGYAPAVVKAPQIKMSGAEAAIFAAFLDEKLRRSGWMLCQFRDVFFTQGARELAEAIRTSFASGPPQGAPKLWISQLSPESAQDTLSDVLADARMSNLTEAYVSDAMESLKKALEDRRRRTQFLASSDTEDRNRIFEQLKERKGDKEEPSLDDGLF